MRVESHIEAQEAILERNDPRGRIGIYFDEWGTWYDPTPGASALYQQNTIRDALVAALHFHAFHRHAERVHMANIAQTVNVLQAMILTEGDAMVLTPTYHLFRMYIPFQDASFLPVSFDSEPVYEFGEYSVPAVSATAARGTDGRLYTSVVNLDSSETAEVTLAIAGGGARNPTIEILTASEIDGHNSFDAPDRVEPQAFEDFTIAGGQLSLTLPARSIVMIGMD
jgi:alpha-N-arabinofuranosidase